MKIYGHDNVTVLPTNPTEGRCVFLSPDGVLGALWYYNGYSWISLDTTDYARYKPQVERHFVLLEPTLATRFYWDPVDTAPISQVAELLPSGTVVSIAADIELPMAQDVYTFFGVNSSSHQILPIVSATSEPGNFIRGYVGGIFKIGADLTNPVGLLNSDIMCGIVVTGTNTSYTARLVVNGVEQLAVSDIVPLTSLHPVLDTTLPVCSPGDLNGLTGYVHSFAAAFNGVGSGFEITSQWNTSVYPPQPVSVLSFDTLNVKTAWYVDQDNLTSSLQSASPHSALPPNMYTTPQVAPTVGGYFNWSNLPDGGDVAPDGYRHYYDAPTSTILNVRLGGNIDSWAWSGSEAQDPVTGIYYNLGYSQAGQVQQSVIGGTYTPADNWVQLHSNPYEFITNNVNYSVPNQTNGASVVFTSGDTFSYPGIASRASIGGGYIQALNTNQPVLFEMWYSRMS